LDGDYRSDCEGRVRAGDHASLQWYRFGELSPALLYEVLRFRQAIFVVEQRCAYPDLDGLDQQALHLLLRLGGESGGGLAGCLRLIPFPEEARVKIGRVAVAETLRGQGLARRLMREALARCRRDYSEWAVMLSGQTYLAPFYESLGFTVTSAPYDDYGLSHVDMALVPSPAPRPLSARKRAPVGRRINDAPGVDAGDSPRPGEGKPGDA
jgi:ElaA protein